MLPAKLGLIWPRSFRGEDLFNISQSETRIAHLAGSIYVRSSIKFLRFVPFGQQIWLPRAILVSDWLMLNKSSPLKLLGEIKLNLAGSIYARSSIKHLHLVPFGPWQPYLLAKQNEMKKLYRGPYIDASCQV
jgi:hypothetical protein